MAEKMAAKRKLWTTERVEAAYEAVINGKRLREASRMHNVPVETQSRRVNGSDANLDQQQFCLTKKRISYVSTL